MKEMRLEEMGGGEYCRRQSLGIDCRLGQENIAFSDIGSERHKGHGEH